MIVVVEEVVAVVGDVAASVTVVEQVVVEDTKATVELEPHFLMGSLRSLRSSRFLDCFVLLLSFSFAASDAVEEIHTEG